jgi:hypothetical protein
VRRSWIGSLLAIGAALALAGVVFARSWTPAVPADDRLPHLARVTAPAATDPGTGDDQETAPPVPVSSACVDRETDGAAPMQVCWGIFRVLTDTDPEKDYYILRVTGSLEPSSPAGSRWASLLATFVGTPAGNVFSAWPESETTGDCATVDVDLRPIPFGAETICGRTLGAPSGPFGQRATWTCVGCVVVPDRQARTVLLYEEAAVPQGASPAWDIYGDTGS